MDTLGSSGAVPASSSSSSDFLAEYRAIQSKMKK